MSDDVDMFDALSSPEKTDIIWRYAMSKLMVHLCFYQLVQTLSKGDWSDVVVNLINPGWCGTDLSRAKPHPVIERISFALMGWSAEKGSRIYVYALAAGKKSNGTYMSECQFRNESAFVRSDRGRRIERKVWKDLMTRIGKISAEVADFIC
jgi:NAD(P)-dependent dehydrogenase (short-subunit alcohol dehydrogenase family)